MAKTAKNTQRSLREHQITVIAQCLARIKDSTFKLIN